MTDRLVRAITADGMVKATAVTTRELTERAQADSQNPACSHGGPRPHAGGCVHDGQRPEKRRASLSIQVRGGGPVGAIVAISDSEGNVRGYAEHPQVDLPLRSDGKLDVGAAVGCDGTLTVIKDLHMKEPYIGSVQLLGGEIAEDIAQYFVESEQIPTACALGVLVGRDQSVRCAGGYLIQLLPGAGEDIISKVEAGVYAAGAVTKLLTANDDPEAMLRTVLSDFELEVLETAPVAYHCTCSRDRVERALLSLGAEELQQLIDEQGQAELTCQFCDQVHRFSGEDLRRILERARKK